MSIGRTLAEVLQIYRDNAAILLSLAALVFLPLTLLTDIVSREDVNSGVFVSLIFSGSAAFLYTGLVTPLVLPRFGEDRRESGPGEPPTITMLWQQSASRFGGLILAGLLYTLATTLGVMLLILPGLILITIWAVAPVVLRLEGHGAIRSLARSRELVRGHGWQVFALMMLVVLLVLLVTVLIQGLAITFAGEDSGSFVGSWVGVVVAAPMLGLMPAVLYRFLIENRPPAAVTAPASPPSE